MSWMKITGYADKFGVHPGETIKFFVNCDGPKEYKAELVKMIHGDTNPRGPGFMEEPIEAACNATYEGVRQEIEEIIGLDASGAVLASAKTGVGITEVPVFQGAFAARAGKGTG